MRKFTVSLLLALVLNVSCSSGDGGTESSNETFKTVKIGNQVWQKYNLNIVSRTGESECYENDPANCSKYGRLYDWVTATKACPEGWHLPTDRELRRLTDFAGDSTAGIKLRASSNKGTDEFGFSALPVCDSWWSASECRYGYCSYAAYQYKTYDDRKNVSYESHSKSASNFVRCLQD